MSIKTAVVVVQARLGSTRLPGKLFYKLADFFLIDHVLTRALKIGKSYKLILATTNNPEDDELVAYCENNYQIKITRGSEDNLYERYLQALEEHATDEEYLIRITADDPVRDYDLAARAITLLDAAPKAYAIVNSGSNRYPLGVETEICRINHLKSVPSQVRDPYINEHIFPMYRSMTKELCLPIQPEEDYSNLHLTIDTLEDVERVNELMSLTSAIKNKSSIDLTWQELVETEKELQKTNADY